MSQHAGLHPERWARFDFDRQVLMIANEMHRATRLSAPGDAPSRRRAYERVLRLTDLTAQTRPGYGRRREILRWRGLVGALYLAEGHDPRAHREALRALLLLTPASAKQVPLLGL